MWIGEHLLEKLLDFANLETPLPYGWLLAGSTISGECSPVHIVSKIMKLCDYVVANKSKSIAHN